MYLVKVVLFLLSYLQYNVIIQISDSSMKLFRWLIRTWQGSNSRASRPLSFMNSFE